MERKFIVPVVTMLTGITVWIAFFLANHWFGNLSPALKVILSLLVGGLVVFSGIRCRHVGGPRLGSIVRTILLCLMAIFTFWKIGMIAAAILLPAALVTGFLAIIGPVRMEASGD